MFYLFDVFVNSVNDAIRINCYNNINQFFDLHRDAQYCPNPYKRTLFSVIIYLNQNIKGGQTQFYHLSKNDYQKIHQNSNTLLTHFYFLCFVMVLIKFLVSTEYLKFEL